MMQITEELVIPIEGVIPTIQKESRFNLKLLKANGVLLGACFIILMVHVVIWKPLLVTMPPVLMLAVLFYVCWLISLLAKRGRTSKLLKLFGETDHPAMIFNQNGVIIPIIFICSNQPALHYFLKKEQKTFFLHWDDIKKIDLKSPYLKSPNIELILHKQSFSKLIKQLLLRGDLLAGHAEKIMDMMKGHIIADSFDPETQQIKALEKRRGRLGAYAGVAFLLTLILGSVTEGNLVQSVIFAVALFIFLAIVLFSSWNDVELYRLLRKHAIDGLNKLNQSDLNKIYGSYKMDILLAFMTLLIDWPLYILIVTHIIPKGTWKFALLVATLMPLCSSWIKTYNGIKKSIIFQHDDENAFQVKEDFSRNAIINVDPVIRRESFINKNDIKILARKNIGSNIILGFWGYVVANNTFNFGAPFDNLSNIGPSWLPDMIPKLLMVAAAPVIITFIVSQLYNNEILVGKNHKRSWKLWQLYNEDKNAVMIIDQRGISIPIVLLNKDEMLDYFLVYAQKTLFLPWMNIKSLVAVSRERSGLQGYEITLHTPISKRLGAIIKLRGDLLGDIMEQQFFDHIDIPFINSHVVPAIE